jgi:hypothetical protein
LAGELRDGIGGRASDAISVGGRWLCGNQQVQATAFALDWFRRAVLAELELLEVSTAPGQSPSE